MRIATTLLSFSLGVAPVSCSDERGYKVMDDDIPAANCGSSGSANSACQATDTSESSEEDLCRSSDDCEDGYCGASFDGDRSRYECRAFCFNNMDETTWCADSGGCCDPAASCSPRGYCVPAGDTEVDTTTRDSETRTLGSPPEPTGTDG